MENSCNRMGRYRKDHEMKITFKRVEYATPEEERQAAELFEYRLEKIITQMIYDGIARGELKVNRR